MKEERRKKNEATNQTAVARVRVSSSKIDFSSSNMFRLRPVTAQLKKLHKENERSRAP